MTVQSLSVADIAMRARQASRNVAAMTSEARVAALCAMAQGITAHRDAIKYANEKDLREAAGASSAFLDRLKLTDSRIDAMAHGIEVISDLPDQLGETLSVYHHPAGMAIRKVRVPLGVILIIYESRPNVTADAAALCFKGGNAAILRGGSEALRTNQAILEAMLGGTTRNRTDRAATGDVPAGAIQLVQTSDRRAVRELLTLDRDIDLVIPRGGEELIRAVSKHAAMPVLRHYKGVCHVYVDRNADAAMAERIIVNTKCQRPGVCNAVETLLVHESIADSFMPRIGAALRDHQVEIRGDEQVCAYVPGAIPATEEDWYAEYLDLILAVRIVADLDAAIEHIERYGSRHSDAIVTNDEQHAQQFCREVDSAAVYVNCSTRFTDGAEFGMGAEVGISTDKLHARGPCGVEALTTYKYIIDGNGQIRE